MRLKLLSLLLLIALLLTTLGGCVIKSSFQYGESETSSEALEAEDDVTVSTKPTKPTESATRLPSSNTSSSSSGKEEEEPSVPQNSKLEVHFIDVGQADASLIVCDGKTMLIDGGNVGDSNLLYSYLQKKGVRHLDYVVATHAHEDHVGGLAGALSYASVGVALSPVLTYSTKAFSNFVKKVEDNGISLTVPKAGDSFVLGGATVQVLGPVKEYDEPNNTSIVLRVVYGSLSFLFTGDMESDAEADLIESGAILQSTVLKVGHHGSSTSSSYRFLREVRPSYGVISVGTDNDYGHPHEEVLSRYRDAEVKLYRTDLQGDIVCTSDDGKTLRFETRKNQDAVTNPTEGEEQETGSSATEYSYIGNVNSKVYHSTDCYSLPNLLNRIYFITKAEAENAGYHACGRCKP